MTRSHDEQARPGRARSEAKPSGGARQARPGRARSEAKPSGGTRQARPGRARSEAKPSGGARLEIRYCTRCRFLPRASWLAQELLTTFVDELGEVALVPGESGVFQVHVGGERVWCRKSDGGFPELAELKRRVRDRVSPGKSLGHSEPAE